MDNKAGRILVVCTGNSCRSILGEALINARCEGRYRASSAGSQPVGYVHPKALETLRRHGIDAGDPMSQSWDEFATDAFAYVITVCDNAAGEACPAFPGTFTRLHWGLPDPAKVEGTDAEVDAAFEATFQALEQRIARELL